MSPTIKTTKAQLPKEIIFTHQKFHQNTKLLPIKNHFFGFIYKKILGFYTHNRDNKYLLTSPTFFPLPFLPSLPTPEIILLPDLSFNIFPSHTLFFQASSPFPNPSTSATLGFHGKLGLSTTKV